MKIIWIRDISNEVYTLKKINRLYGIKNQKIKKLCTVECRHDVMTYVH